MMTTLQTNNLRRIRLIVEYNGARYVGWQRQSNGVAVQECLERAIKTVTGETLAIHASGRTDAGVHACAQVVHFDTASRVPADKFPFALNTALPKDIRVVYGDCPSADFHARFDVLRKHYRYTLLCAPHMSSFYSDRALHVHCPLDYSLLEQSAAQIIGEHDFAAFKAQGTSVKTTVRRIYESAWTCSGALLYYDISGSGFMYNMVRILVGTMLSVAKGQSRPDAIAHALFTHDRQDAADTAPAHGLMLTRVEYNDFDTADHIIVLK